jgi:hypothetical protein
LFYYAALLPLSLLYFPFCFVPGKNSIEEFKPDCSI